jgi:hypothetical protein
MTPMSPTSTKSLTWLINYHYWERKDSPTYSFEGSLIVSVYASAMKFRDRPVRRNAIRILRRREPREGIMDSALRARLIEL